MASCSLSVFWLLRWLEVECWVRVSSATPRPAISRLSPKSATMAFQRPHGCAWIMSAKEEDEDPLSTAANASLLDDDLLWKRARLGTPKLAEEDDDDGCPPA